MKRIFVAVAALLATLASSGCVFDPAMIPVPGTKTPGDKYPLHIEFANVLNLPPGAKVTANGIQVGDLDKVRIVEPASTDGGYVVATVKIKTTVQLPTTTKAELRQATPLGDVHIALITPPGAVQSYFEPEATIPRSQTAQTAQVEDTLTGLASAVGGGAINNLQDTIRQLNAALPSDRNETARIFGQLKSDLIDVGANIQTVDSVLDGLQANTDVLRDDSDIIDEMLTDTGVEHEVEAISSIVKILFIFTALGPLSHQVAWLGPLVGGLDATASSFVPMLLGTRPLDLESPANFRKLVDLIQHKIIPFVQNGPKVDIQAAGVPGAAMSPADQTGRIIETLRMVGAVR